MEKGNDSKYFYVVVLLTVGLVGIVVWQLFFADDMFQIFDEPGHEDVPEIDFSFFDSYTFQDLDEFRRGDDPLLPWRQIRNQNPFRSPEIPRSRSLRDWWSVFNIKLQVENQEWEGFYPSMIEGDTNPTITLFEDRWYELKWTDLDEGHYFSIMNEDEEELKRKEDEEPLRFQASTEMTLYGNSEVQGDIEVIEEGEYEVLRDEEYDDEDQSDIEILMTAGSELSGFYDEIRTVEENLTEEEVNQAQRVYSQLEGDFQEIEEEVQRGQLTEEALEREVENFRNEIESALNNLRNIESEEVEEGDGEPEGGIDETDEEEENDELDDDELEAEEEDEEIVDYEEVDYEEDDVYRDQVESALEDLRDELDYFEEDIERMEDDDHIQEAVEVYNELLSSFEDIEEEFESGEVDYNTSLNRIRELYEKGDQLISELSFYQ